MSQRPRIEIRQNLRLKLSTGLHAAINVLRMDGPDLTRHLEDQAAEVPGLVVVPQMPRQWLPRWTGVFAQEAGGAEQAAPAASLMGHVLAQIDLRIQGAGPRRIALALAESLGPAGWLDAPTAEIARRAGVTLAALEPVLAELQKMEPTGIFARDLADCLRLQAIEADLLDGPMAVILSRLDLLARGDFAALAAAAGVGEAEILQRFRQIRTMNPKPGASFDDMAAPPLREPDLVLTGPPGWQVDLCRSSLPALSLTPEAGAEARRRKSLLDRLVTARNDTLLRVAREVLSHQRPALEEAQRGTGRIARDLPALLPLTMAEVGRALDLSESTVSRVVAGASVDTPWGVWWLRKLFSRDMGGVSAAALRARLARAVAEETSPLSDQALAEVLSVDGVTIARRTVAKYREELGIPAAARRRR